MGVHNRAPWCDIVTGVSPADSAGKILAMYYGEGERAFMRLKTQAEYSVRSAAGTDFQVRIEVVEGRRLKAKFSAT